MIRVILLKVAFADRLLVNKIDLMPETVDLRRVEYRLRQINKFAPIVRCEKSQVSVDNVLEIRSFDLNRTIEMDPEFLNIDGKRIFLLLFTLLHTKRN